MKTRPIISLTLSALIGVLAVDLVVMLYRMAFDGDLFDITGLIVPTVLGAAAGALIGYGFWIAGQKASKQAVRSEQPLPETEARELPAHQSLPVREGSEAAVQEDFGVPIQARVADLPTQVIEPEASAESQPAANETESAGTVEELPVLPLGPDADAETRLAERKIPGGSTTPAAPDDVGQLPRERESRDRDATDGLEETAEQRTMGEVPPNREEFLARFMENAPTFLVALDAQGKLVMTNRRMVQSLGYSEEEVIGMDFITNFVPERSRGEGLATLLKPAATPAEPTRIEDYVLAKDGREVLVEWHGTPVFDPTDRLLNCFLVGIDVSTRKQAEEVPGDRELPYKLLYEEARTGLEHYRSVLDSSPDALVIYNTEGKATYTNSAFTAIFGWSLEDLQEGQTPFLPESQRDVEQPKIESLIENATRWKDFDTKRCAKDGRLFSARVTARLFHDRGGDPAGMLVVLRDIAEQKEVEKEREQRMPEPAKRQISAKEVAKDIRSGATDSALMEKYKLTVKGLQSVFQKLLQANILKPQEIYGRLASYDETVAIEVSRIPTTEILEPPRKTIKSSQLTADIRAGITNAHMMEKYGLTAGGLDSILEQLVAGGVVSPDEIHGNSPPDTQEEEEDKTARREYPRNYMVVSVPIYEANSLLSEGTIIDISEKGLKIQGIDTVVGETKGLLVQGDEFHDVYPFVFDAVCRWARTDETSGEMVSGFQITAISDASLDELRKLIAALSITS